MDHISLRDMPLKLHEWPLIMAFKLKNELLGPFSDWELKGLGPLKVRSLKGFSHQKIKEMPSVKILS